MQRLPIVQMSKATKRLWRTRINKGSIRIKIVLVLIIFVPMIIVVMLIKWLISGFSFAIQGLKTEYTEDVYLLKDFVRKLTTKW